MDRFKRWVPRFAIEAAIFAAFIGTLFWRPDIFAAIVQGGIALSAVVVLLFVAFVVWAATGRSGWTKGPFADDRQRLGHVGISGKGVGLSVDATPDKPLRIELSHWTYLIFLGIWGLFGPGLFLFLCGSPDHWTLMPLSAGRLLALLFAIVIVGLLVFGIHHYLARRSVVEVSDEAIRLLVGNVTLRVIPRGAVKALTIVDHELRDEDGGLVATYKNYSVRADLVTGEGVALCIADNRLLIEGIASAIDARLGLSA